MLRENIQKSDEYQALTADPAQDGDGDSASRTRARSSGGAPAFTLTFGDMEQGDAAFWLQVAQTVLLLLIWRELARGGR